MSHLFRVILLVFPFVTAPVLAEKPEAVIAACRAISPEHSPAVQEAQGVITRVRCFRGDIEDGPARKYSTEGRLIVEGQFKDGQMAGRWIRRDPEGTLLDQGSWDNGHPTGRWEVYNPTSRSYVDREYAADGTIACQDPPDSRHQKPCVRSALPPGRRFQGLVRAEGMVLLQDSGGFSSSPSLGIDLRFKVSNWFALTAGADQSALASASTPRVLGVTQAQVCVALIRIPFLVVALGGGAQWWWNMVRPFPSAHAQISLRTQHRWLLIFQEVQVSITGFFFPSDPALVGRVGVGIPL